MFRRSLFTKLSTSATPVVSANGISYNLPLPNKPVVAIAVDGINPDYINQAVKAGAMPTWKKLLDTPHSSGSQFLFSDSKNRSSFTPESFEEMDFFSMKAAIGTVATAFPTFATVNTASIITGVGPSQTGIVGSSGYNMEKQRQSLLTAGSIKCESVLAQLEQSKQVKVKVITSSEWLSPIFTHNMNTKNIESLTTGYQGVLRRMEEEIATKDASSSQYYLSIDNKTTFEHPPGSEEANIMLQEIDALLNKLVSNGYVVGITATHGSNRKSNFDGGARVINIDEVIQQNNLQGVEVLLPVDPNMKYGSLAMLTVSKEDEMKTLEILRATPGVYAAVGRKDALKAWDLDESRIGDIVLLGDHATVFTSNEKTDIAVDNLRSTGSMDESTVMMYIGAPVKKQYRNRLDRGKARNYSLLEYLLNGVAGTPDLEMSKVNESNW